MKKKAYLVGFFCLTLCLANITSAFGISTNTRVTNPNAINLELAGRGLLYNISFDRVLSENLAAGIGLGLTTAYEPTGAKASTNATSLIVPLYANYYFMKDAGSIYATVGASIVANSANISGYYFPSNSWLQFSAVPVIPTVGGGYEYRSDAGYLIRGTLYGMYSQNFAIWFGFTFGYSF